MIYEKYLTYATQSLIMVCVFGILYWMFFFGNTTKRNAIAVSFVFASLAAAVVVVLLRPAGVWLLLASTYAAVLALATSVGWWTALRHRAREKAARAVRKRA